MNKDFVGALVLIGVFAVMMAMRIQFPPFLEATLHVTRPLATIVALGAVAALYLYKYHVTALVAGMLSIYLLKTIWVTWPRSDKRRLFLDISADQARFDPATSIDLQFANGTATHNLPVLLSKPLFPEMLVFPPSPETQEQMNG
jgi:hypothetical protein